MSDTKLISRRDVMLGAGATALAVSTTAAHAGDKENPDSPDYDARQRTRLLHLTITQSDGSTVRLDARELTVDFGGNAKIKLQPDGFLPISDGGESERPSNK